MKVLDALQATRAAGIGSMFPNRPPEIREPKTSFGDMLTKAVSDVNSLQQDAASKVEQMVTGEVSDLHDVMIAAEKAKTSFELLMEVRNKALDGYKEIMRMQV